MKILETLLAFLKKPFPEDESRLGFLKITMGISLFIVFFLYIFQPFGISNLESSKFLLCLGFGSMTFIGVLIYEFTIGQFIKWMGVRAPWTFLKWMLNNLGIMIFISLANFLFIRIFFFGFIQWDLFPAMIYGTFMIGIIPFTILGGITLNKQEKKFQSIADEINQKKTNQPINSNSAEITLFDIPISQIKFVEALQNYVKIGHVNSDGQFVQKTERTTLKHIIKETEGSTIIKCHRSFLVNRTAIISTSGNAQGLLLKLSGCDTIIPVSRSYVPDFRSK